jgi:hypothetical protein
MSLDICMPKNAESHHERSEGHWCDTSDPRLANLLSIDCRHFVTSRPAATPLLIVRAHAAQSSQLDPLASPKLLYK